MAFPTDWIKKTSDDLRSIGESFVALSRRFHKHAQKLENAVEGQLASDASDLRVRLLNEALQVSSKADVELGRLNVKLARITQDWQNVLANHLGKREEATKSTSSFERNEPETWYEIARTLNSTLEFDNVLQLVMDHVIGFVNAERGFLMLINAESGEPEFTIARDMLRRPIESSEFTTISYQTVKRVIRTGKPVLADDAQTDLEAHDSVFANDIRSIMCAPLIVRGHCIGAVYVDRRFTTTLFEPQHRELLLAFCNQAAIAIENARLFDDLNKTMKQVKEDKQYMENIFGSIANGVVTTDSAGIITAFNAAAGTILMVSSDQMVGQHYSDAFKSLPQVGLVPLLDRAYLEHPHGTMVNETITCTIPGRFGPVSLNCYVCSLRDTQDRYIGMALVIDDQTSEERAKKVRRMFEQYVHPHVVRELIQNSQALKLGGETKEISVVFADIRGYTPLNESMPPNTVMDLINGYLERMCDAIWQEEGTLTAFQGDALMAIFNAPLPQDDHALRAVRAAWKMREAVLRYRSDLPEKWRVSFGFGVNTGLATVGNVGAKGRLQNYTAIGDVINVAARLQSNATDNDIFLNAPTCEKVHQLVQIGPPFSLSVKGKATPLTVGRLLGLG